MANNNDGFTWGAIAVSLFLLGVEVYYGLNDLYIATGNVKLALSSQSIFGGLYSNSHFLIKGCCFALIVLGMMVMYGTTVPYKWSTLITLVTSGIVLFWLPKLGMGPGYAVLYAFTTLLGYVLLIIFYPQFCRKLFSLSRGRNLNTKNTFDQEHEKIENDDSINIPLRFRYNDRWNNGWINVVAPFRGTMILGTPGSGKSFSIVGPVIEQCFAKDYTFFTYDYKFPTLTNDMYYEYKKTYGKFMKDGITDKGEPIPKFCVINFNDPRYSMRCNPLHPSFIRDAADAMEKAELIMRNIDPYSVTRKDFFSQSASSFIASGILMLRRYKDGKYCTFPHLLELINRDYTSVFDAMLLDFVDGKPCPWLECKNVMTAFDDARKNQAKEQLQGQIASARIPMSRFTSPLLFWIMSGDDFTLDLNNPKEPKILCVGNDPDRQQVYSTTLALMTDGMFSNINHPGRKRCAVILDEMPTIRLKNVDNLIATARSNRVAIFMGAQDKSQLIRDYNENEANVVFNTVGNYLCGQVNGTTARDLSAMFGKEFRLRESESQGENNSSVSTSYQLEEILPSYVIENLSTGTFFGRTQDVFDNKLDKKLFCGEIQIDSNKVKAKSKSIKEGTNSDGSYLPRMDKGAFKDRELVEKILKDDESKENACISSMTSKLIDEALNKDDSGADGEAARKPTTNMTWDDFNLIARSQYEDMSSDEKSALLNDVIKETINKEIERVIGNNYRRIREDINEFFDTIDIPEGKVVVNYEEL